MAVTTEVEEDGLALAFSLAAHGFLDGALDSVVGLRCGHDAFVAGEAREGQRGAALASWRISSIGNSGAKSLGPTGCSVPGCSTGGSALGRSALMLYQA